MVQRSHLGISGLATDANPLVAVPEGALDEASEVVARRVGELEPRPGFKRGTALGSFESIIALCGFRDALLAVGLEGVTPKTRLTTNHTVLDEDAGELSWALDHIRGQEARGNFYLTTSDKPRKLTAVGANQTARGAGVVPPTLHSTTTTSGTFLADGESVSYRFCVKRTDENGLVTRSAPSGRCIVTNDTGSDADVVVAGSYRDAIDFDPATGVGDIIEVYRSLKTTSEVPDDEHFLLREREATAASGTISFTDYYEEDRLGAPLYTNDDEEGEEAANFRPPAARDLALFKDSLFYIGYTDYARSVFYRTGGANQTGENDGIGTRDAVATLTNGSTQISGLNATELAGLEVGMIVYIAPGSNDWLNPTSAPVYIVSIATGFGTCETNVEWNGATGAQAVVFADAMRLESGATVEYYDARFSEKLIRWINIGGTDSSGSAATGYTYTAFPYAFALAIAIAGEFQGTVRQAGFRRLAIEALDATTSYIIGATHGDEYNPELATIASPQTVEPEEHHDRVGWSKTDQPEHFLLSSYQPVGNSTGLLRGIATRDAVWLLKGRGDGVYRLSGFGATSGFRIDHFDSGTYLLAANMAVAFEDRVYLWTNIGLASLSDAGVVPLSGPRIASDTRELETLLDDTTELPGAFAAANHKASEIVMGLPALPLDAGAGAAGRTLVYNTRTGGLTDWFRSSDTTPWLTADGAVSAVGYNLVTRELYFGTTSTNRPRVERLENGVVIHADNSEAITISGIGVVDAADPTLLHVASFSGGGTIAVGDLIALDSEQYAVVEQVSPLHVRKEAGTGFSVGDGDVYKAFTSRVRWLPKTGDAPSVMKRYQECVLHFTRFLGMREWSLRLEQSRDEALGETYDFEDEAYTRSATRTKDHRSTVPRAAHLGTQIVPALEITQADARWRLAGLTLTFEPVTTRLNR